MNRNFIIGAILLIGLTVLIASGNNSVTNNRVDPQLAINEKNMDFQSKLKDMPTDNLETITEAISSVSTEEIASPTDTSSKKVEVGDNITVNYKGWLAKDGTIFDQSFNRGDSGFTFTVGQGVIEGWSEGVVGMQVGEIRRLKIPAEKGYGDKDNGSIPANSDLIFDVELISIN